MAGIKLVLSVLFSPSYILTMPSANTSSGTETVMDVLASAPAAVVAWIVHLPGAIGVTVPLLLTVAISGSDELHDTEMSAGLSSTGVSLTARPGYMVAGFDGRVIFPALTEKSWVTVIPLAVAVRVYVPISPLLTPGLLAVNKLPETEAPEDSPLLTFKEKDGVAEGTVE